VVVLLVCPFVVSFSKFHESDTHDKFGDMLATRQTILSCIGCVKVANLLVACWRLPRDVCYEKVAKKLLSWNLASNEPYIIIGRPFTLFHFSRIFSYCMRQSVGAIQVLLFFASDFYYSLLRIAERLSTLCCRPVSLLDSFTSLVLFYRSMRCIPTRVYR